MRERRRIHFVLATVAVLAGCNALLDIKDINLDENAVRPGADGSNERGDGL